MIECQMYDCIFANQGAKLATHIRIVLSRHATTAWIGHCTPCFIKMYLRLYRFRKNGDIGWQRLDAQAQDVEGNPESIFGFPHQ